MENLNSSSTSLKDCDVSFLEAESLIVPWTFRSEWERACISFNSENYDELVTELLVWKERVPSLPVGVEATLLLIQAELENNAYKNHSKNASEVNVRSMYSLAIIRFINHVTHLAIKEYGDATSVSMFKLMCKVNIPEWIVNLRHEASHGTTLPSIETLLLAAQFCKEWLKKNYWVTPDRKILENEHDSTPEFFVNNPNIENREDLSNFSSCSTLLSAFIACRVYKLRGNDTMKDPEILKLLEELPYPANTKRVAFLLKGKLLNHLKLEPFEFCAAAAEKMVPNEEFCKELTSLFNVDNYFDQLLVIWNPILDILSKNSKLTSISVHLAHIHTQEEVGEHVRSLTALWLNIILGKLEESGKKGPQKLLPVLRIIMKRPNCYTEIFLGSLLKCVVKKLGHEKVSQLKTLSRIWTQDNVNGRRRKGCRKVSNAYFTLGSLASAKNGDVGSACVAEVNNHFAGNWKLDKRDFNFWTHHDLGFVEDPSLNLSKS